MTMLDCQPGCPDAGTSSAATGVPVVLRRRPPPRQTDDVINLIDHGSTSVEAARARLVARGLLQPPTKVSADRTPSGAARQTTHQRMTGAPRSVLPALIADEAADGHSGDDGAPHHSARCLRCSHTQHVSASASGFTCRGCGRAWRWAACRRCDHLALTSAYQGSWRCRHCETYTRSWWRTESAAQEAATISKRRADAASPERAAAQARSRARRRVASAAAAVTAAVLLTIAGAGALAAASAPSPAARTRALCATVDELKSAIANGSVAGEALDRNLADFDRRAAEAAPPVRHAIARLADAGPPGTAQFLVAQTAVADACATATP